MVNGSACSKMARHECPLLAIADILDCSHQAGIDKKHSIASRFPAFVGP